MYRDPTLAAKEKEIARLRDELARAKADDEEMFEKVRKAEEELRRTKEKKASLKHSLSRRHFSMPAMPSIPAMPSFHNLAIGGIFLFIVGMIGLSVYQYFTDIQEGVVTSKEYHPPETRCTTDSDGHTSCTTYPEYWTVDIAYRGQTATWSVSEGEYNQLDQGDWYCYTDLIHDASDCTGPENK